MVYKHRLVRFIILVALLFLFGNTQIYEEQTNLSFIVVAPDGSGTIICHAGSGSDSYLHI